ncbi:MAG: polyprenyl diphosphate synthase [Pseudomonadales bacterium]
MTLNSGAERQHLLTRTDFVLQSTPRHVAIIMDGNRRWARRRGLPAATGHRQGAASLHALLPSIGAAGIETLTLFGFASANWQRASSEIAHIMTLAQATFSRFAPDCVREGIAVQVIGRRDRLPAELQATIDRVERMTAGGARRLRVALDYSSRAAILAAARDLTGDEDGTSFGRLLGDVGDVDLLIRTGCEQRLSDFLLWECAFAELYFPEVLWPDFSPSHLARALCWYATRNRTFGK